MSPAALVDALVAQTSKTSSSGASILPVLLVFGVAFYFLLYRPGQKRARAAQLSREASAGFEVGDEVLTAGGIVGHVIDIDGDRLTLETSVGASFVVLRPYVLRKLESEAAELDGESEHVDDDDGHDHDADHGHAEDGHDHDDHHDDGHDDGHDGPASL
jgi:preprotein translocase YajC subunit